MASPGFARNERLSRFLRFVVECHLAGREADLKESVIGVEVFGRPPDYNPKRDAIVRTEAGRLRARLAEYYANGGRQDALIIELPKGGYVPVIRSPERRSSSPGVSRPHRRMMLALVITVVVLVAAGVALERISRGTSTRPIMKTVELRRYEGSKAFDLYVKARAAYHPAQEIPDPNVDVYQEVISKDPTFAPGFAGLAAAYAFASSTPRGQRNHSPAEMRAAAERAIQLDPLLPEAHGAAGIVYARIGLWEKSGRSFHEAMELAPDSPALRIDFVMNFLLPVGWISNALQQMQIAEKSDSNSPEVQEAYAYVLISAGRFDQAEKHCLKSSDSTECLGRIRVGQGRVNDAIQTLNTARNSRFLAYAYGLAGRREEAESFAAISPGALQQVLIYAGLRDKDRTLHALDRMADFGPVRVGRTLTFPELAFLRGDPRLRGLRKKIGLPEWN